MTSIGGPTDTFGRIVESNEISALFAASLKLVFRLMIPVENGLAVLHLADLKIARVAHRLDEIAAVVNHEKTQLAALYLAGQDEGGGEVDVVLL